jgi:hypothetical protein
MRGIHKLKIILKKARLHKFNFIRDLRQKGYSRIPEDLKVMRFSMAF